MIVSRQNPKLKELRRIRRGKEDSALLEGPHLVEEALRLELPLEIVVATPEFLESPAGGRLAAELPRPPLEVSPPLLHELSDVDSPQGILAVTPLRRGGTELLPLVEGGLYVYAEEIQDPGNLGALARSVEASGGVALVLAEGSAHPNHPRALRSSSGSLLRLPLARRATPEALAEQLGELSPRWVALNPRGGRSLYETSLDGTVVLAVGTEGRGLRPETIDRCDLSVTIPTAPAVESLNATVAASVALFEIQRRRPPSG